MASEASSEGRGVYLRYETPPAPLMIFTLCALVGLAFGSFLTVCIARLPRHESIVSPRSHCRSCARQIFWKDNIPVLSWAILRGRCRFCQAPVSWSYPFVELATSALFVMCWLTFGSTWETAAWALLCFLLLGLAMMDAETRILPDRFTLPGLMLGFAFAGLRSGMDRPSSAFRFSLRAAGLSVLDAAIATAVLLLVVGIYWIARKQMGMGMGDVKLLAMLAAWLGLPRTTLVFVLAVITGALYGLILIVKRRGQGASSLTVPFGTFLCVAGLYGVFLGERTLRWYVQFFP